jgi:protein dithiol oxidoreductase (disulfide-forming)
MSSVPEPAMVRLPSRILALLLVLLLPLAACAADIAPVAGRDYEEIPDGTPYRPLGGKVEVVEVFAYWCPHCAHFQPSLEAWARKLPANVRFDYVPAAFQLEDPLARAFFAAKAAGKLPVTHDATFRAIHEEQTLPRNATVDEIAGFYGTLGLDPAKTKAAMIGFSVGGQMRQAREFALRSGIEGTPTLIINGRYRVTGRTLEDSLRIASALIAQLSNPAQ